MDLVRRLAEVEMVEGGGLDIDRVLEGEGGHLVFDRFGLLDHFEGEH